jgi:lipopolysaccharide heptosyltransferase I
MSDLAARDFRRILIIKPSSPGDIIHALPVLHGLRHRYPAAHIAWLVATPFAELIEVDPALNEVIRFDRKRFGFLGRSLRITGEFLAFLKGLRERDFELVIDLQGLFRSGFLAMATGARTRIGFADAREMAWMFYTDRIPRQEADAHAADRNYAVGRMLGFDGAALDFSIPLAEADHDAARALLRESGIDAGRPFAVLVPGTRWETKRWPADRFGQVARELRDRRGICSVLVGGRDDIPAGEVAVAASEGAAINLCGRTTLRQVAALIEAASLVVTADSTPMHLAAALKRPLVALFGPTNPRRTGPYGRLDDVVRLDLECSPCYLRKLSQCPYGHECMQQLGVDRVSTPLASALLRNGTRQELHA